MIKRILNKLTPSHEQSFPTDFDSFHIDIIKTVKPYTMTSVERLFGLIEAVKYIVEARIAGDIVECGVWKGGSMLAVAETLVKLRDTSRRLFLYDTFEGMTAPQEVDESFASEKASSLLDKDKHKKANSVVWAYSALDEVKNTMQKTAYPQPNIEYVKGDVLQTIPAIGPEEIALLRLDTDWYESTKHELIQLYPKLKKHGVLIIDDYGYWRGSRKAVDEYFAENNIPVLLNRMDDTGRITVKL